MPTIHPLAAVDPRAELDADVTVGPFCVVGPDVRLGAGCVLHGHVTLAGRSRFGQRNQFFAGCALGLPPQDKKYRGETTALEVGDDNHFREACTVHVGTVQGGGVTRVGSGNLFMVNAHLGHDGQVGDETILANNVMLAGHVHVGDRATLLGGVGVHHFTTIGAYSFITGYARVQQDVPPFCKLDLESKVRAVNTVGLSRAGISEEAIDALEDAVRQLFLDRGTRPFSRVMTELETQYAPAAPNGNGHHASPKHSEGGGTAVATLPARITAPATAPPRVAPDGVALPAPSETTGPDLVRQLVAFLQRRTAGRHGRYLESKR